MIIKLSKGTTTSRPPLNESGPSMVVSWSPTRWRRKRQNILITLSCFIPWPLFSICAPMNPFSAFLLFRWRQWCKGGIEDQSWVTSLLLSAAGTSTTPWRIRTASKNAHNITLLSPKEQKQQVPCHSLLWLINSHSQRQSLDAKSSQVFLLHRCHLYYQV